MKILTRYLLLILWPMFFLMMTYCKAQDQTSGNLLEDLMRAEKEVLEKVVKQSDKYELQIIYTQIDRDEHNKPSFHTITYGIDSSRYFYPASQVKLPIALLALEKINKLQIKGLDKYTPLRIGAVRKPQKEVTEDTTAKNGLPSIAQYIKKMFVVSNNDAYNRVYEFLGQQYINETLWKKGYEDLRITQRLSTDGFEEEDNRYTNPVTFYIGEGKEIYTQPEVYNPEKYPGKIKNPYKGKAHVNSEGELLETPFDFREKNYMALHTIHSLLKAVIFPETVEEKERFELSERDYRYLYKCMSMLPRESKYPPYTKKYHQDGFMKYILLGDTKERMPATMRIFNKVGLSYGFLVENAYVVDFDTKTEFMLTAVLYVNENQILNDNRYEYKETGFPFFVNLGKALLAYEKKRPRKYLPDLRRFKVSYAE